MARTSPSSSSDSDDRQRDRRHHGRQRPEAGAASPPSPNGRYKPRSPGGGTAARTSRVPPSDRATRMQRDRRTSESGGSDSDEGRDKNLRSKEDQPGGHRQQQLEDGEIEGDSDRHRSNGRDRDDRNDRWEEGDRERKRDRRRVDSDRDRERRREKERDAEEDEGRREISRREKPRDGGNDDSRRERERDAEEDEGRREISRREKPRDGDNDDSRRERMTEKGRDYRDRDGGRDRRRERLGDEDDDVKRERRTEEKIDNYGDDRKRETQRERMQVDEDGATRKWDSRQERGRDDRKARDREKDIPRGDDRPRERRRGVRHGSSDEDLSPHRREKNREGESRHRRDERRGEGNGRRREEEEVKKVEKQPKPLPAPDPMAKRTGGIYIPPFKLAQMMREVQDKSSEAYQRLSWDALRKSINGLVNKVNATNIKNIIPELFSENLIRGRGLFCRSCMKSQMASPGFTDVFAALVAVVNTKFPEVGRLLVSRIVLQLKRAYKRNDKPQLLAATKFVAHLVNQLVAHEVIALELLTVLLENPTDDGVEVAVGFVKECGALLQDISPQGLHGIFERFRGILHEGEIDKRVQFLIEGLFAIRKAKFQGFPAVRPELDLVEQEDQFTHEISLSEDIDPETQLDIFKPNPNFLEDDKAYEDLKKSILGAEPSDEEEGSDAETEDEDEEETEEEEDDEQMQIKDETETNLINLRRTIYLTIMSSLDFEEAGHKLLKIKLEPGQEMELCIMLLECCSQERTYNRYYGLLGQRFCMINKIHQENFEKCFVQQYLMIHRLETNKLRNVAKFFAHLLATKALSWHVLAYIRLTEEDTTSSSRIFIKILFQELSEHLGIRLLNETLNDPTMQESFESIFPKDNPKNTRFSINFFTSIGLGGITESLREYLKNMPRLIMQQQKPVAESEDESGSSSGSGSDSGSESDSESKSESSSDESERKKRHAKRSKRN